MKPITAITAAVFLLALPIGGAMAESKPIAFTDCRDAVVLKVVTESVTLPAIKPGLELARSRQDAVAESKFEAIIDEAEGNIAQADAYIAQNECKLPATN